MILKSEQHSKQIVVTKSFNWSQTEFGEYSLNDLLSTPITNLSIEQLLEQIDGFDQEYQRRGNFRRGNTSTGD